MKSRSIAALASIALSSVFSLGIHQAMAQSNPQYVLGLAHGVKGVLWLPPKSCKLPCRRHRHSSHIELSGTSVVLEPVAARIYGSLHE